MDTIKICALGMLALLGAGCDEAAGSTNRDAAAGSAGSGGAELAGSGGSAGHPLGTDGAAGKDQADAADAPCDSQAPSEVDGGMDAALATPHDAGDAATPRANGDDAGADGDASDAGAGPASAPRVAGSLLISELMADPTLVGDAVGEWIELHNTTDVTLELSGCGLRDDRNDEVTLQALRVSPHGYVVLGRSASAATHVDQIYAGMVLANSTDEIVVTCSDQLIDRIAYTSEFPHRAGRSLQLDPSRLTASANDAASAWCASEDSGTPGGPNVACAR